MQEDAEIIEAVRSGDRELFGELVERHQRQAFGIAWSRLGDPELAEEASQEAFVRAFKSLRDLREPSRFPAWLGRIVRNVATKIGRREQRELEARERWSLDPGIQAEKPADNEESSEAELRSAIEDLPDDYREALVLFYLRGESMAKAAELAGLSEGSFRTRLHRARKKLRVVLEQRTEEGLKRLGPARNLAPLVMALLPAAPASAGAAGLATVVGGKTIGGAFKVGGWFLAFPFMQLALMLGFMSATSSATIRSFRDPDDPRIQLFRRSRSFRLLLLLLIVTTVYLLVSLAKFLSVHLGSFRLGRELPFLFFAVLLVPGALAAFRQLRVNRSVFLWTQFLSVVAFAVLLTLVGLGIMPSWWIYSGILFSMLSQLFQPRQLKMGRMDHNLFLRLAIGGMNPPPDEASPQEHLSDGQLKRIGYWFGNRYLVRDRAIDTGGMTLSVVDAQPGFSQVFGFTFFECSSLRINRDGSVRGFLSAKDYGRIKAGVDNPPSRERLEEQTSRVVEAAVRVLVRGDEAQAEQILARQSAEEIAHRPPLATWVHVSLGVLSLIGFSLLFSMGLAGKFDYRPANARLEAVDIPDAAAIEALNELLPFVSNPRGQEGSEFIRSAAHCLRRDWYQGTIHLPLDVLVDPTRATLKSNVFGNVAVDLSQRKWGLDIRNEHFLMLTSGLFSANEWTLLNYTPNGVRESYQKTSPLRSFRNETLDKRLFGRAPSLRIQGDIWQLAWVLRHFKCDDLFHREQVIEAVVKRQIPADSDQIPEWVDATVDMTKLRGLFVFRHFTLENNWHAIRTLHVLDALDRFNREAFLERLLELHRGGGVFGERSRHEGFRLRRDPKDTFYGLDCLLMLGAADRIKDLDEWKFRDYSRTGKPIRWDGRASELVAWIYQKRLEEILKMPTLPATFFPLSAAE